MIRNLLIVKPSSLGDIVLALPVLAALRRALPAATIGWVVKKEWRSLLDGHPALNHVYSAPFTLAGFTALLQEIRLIRWDVAMDLQGLFRSGFLTFFSKAPIRIGFATSPYAREGASLFYTTKVSVPHKIHRVERYLLSASALGIATGATEFVFPVLHPQERVNAWIANTALPRVALHPFTRGGERAWPLERWKQCGNMLVRQGISVFYVGVGDRNMFPPDGGGTLNLVGRTTLPELVALLGKINLLVTADSGPMHIAAALGTPTVALFGPTDPKEAGPCGAGHCVIHRQSLSAIGVEEVVEKILMREEPP